MKFVRKAITFIRLFLQKRKNRKILKKQKSQPMGINYIDLRKETNPLDADLISDNLNEKEKKTLRQTTKQFMWTLVLFAIIWITWSYILSTISLMMYGNAEPLSDLSREVCSVVLGTVLGYMAKSFVETFAQKTSEMIERHWNKNNDVKSVETDSNEPVG